MVLAPLGIALSSVVGRGVSKDIIMHRMGLSVNGADHQVFELGGKFGIFNHDTFEFLMSSVRPQIRTAFRDAFYGNGEGEENISPQRQDLRIIEDINSQASDAKVEDRFRLGVNFDSNRLQWGALTALGSLAAFAIPAGTAFGGPLLLAGMLTSGIMSARHYINSEHVKIGHLMQTKKLAMTSPDGNPVLARLISYLTSQADALMPQDGLPLRSKLQLMSVSSDEFREKVDISELYRTTLNQGLESLIDRDENTLVDRSISTIGRLAKWGGNFTLDVVT